MKFKTILVLWILLLALCLVPIFWKTPVQTRDMVYYSSVTDSIAKGGDAPDDCRVIMVTDPDYEAELNSYLKNGALAMDIMSDGQLVGKAVWDDMSGMRSESERDTKIKMLVVWGVSAAAGTILIAMIYTGYIRPFKKLQKFTGEVARGNLDFPLSVGRNDFFGNFTESFDIMREELKSARAKEASLQKAKQEMLAELSHDIRTPLAIINATCEVLEVKNPGKDVGEKTQIIKSKITTIDSLINNMMNASLAEAEELKVEPREESSLLIKNMVTNLKDAAAVNESGELPECLLYYDPLRLEQVIDNVVGNSIKYAGTDIDVEYGRTEGGVIIRISDKGPGVPEEELSLVTQKFWRGSKNPDVPGSGLGLFLADFFMKKMQGDISFYNDNKNGGFVAEIFVKKV